MFNWVCYLRRAVVAVILLGVVLYHSAGLMRLLERALSAPPRQQAARIVFAAVIVLLGSIVRSCAAMVVGDHGASTAHTVVPIGVARLAHPGAVARSDLERWAEIHKNKGESTKDAVKRLEPLWNQRELGEDISIKQRRRHEAAHAVITHVLGGTVMSADVRDRGNTAGRVESFPPIPSAGPAHTMWVRLQIAVAGAAQDTLDGILNAGSSTDIDKALRQAVSLTAAAWTPARSTPVTSSSTPSRPTSGSWQNARTPLPPSRRHSPTRTSSPASRSTTSSTTSTPHTRGQLPRPPAET